MNRTTALPAVFEQATCERERIRARIRSRVQKSIEDRVEDLPDFFRTQGNESPTETVLLVALSAKANFKVLGPRLGKQMKVVAQAIEGLEDTTLRSVLNGATVEVEGHTLGADDLLFHRKPVPGRVTATDGDITVVLDTTETEELVYEGLVRELINRVQNLRKSSKLDISDHIDLAVTCTAEGKLFAALAREELWGLIQAETLARSLVVNPATELAHRSEDQIDDDKIVVSLARIADWDQFLIGLNR